MRTGAWGQGHNVNIIVSGEGYDDVHIETIQDQWSTRCLLLLLDLSLIDLIDLVSLVLRVLVNPAKADKVHRRMLDVSLVEEFNNLGTNVSPQIATDRAGHEP